MNSRNITDNKQEIYDFYIKKDLFLALSTEIGTALTNEKTLEGMLRNCVKAFLLYLHVELACIWTFQLGSKEWELKACTDLDHDLDGRGTPPPIGNAFVERIARERRPYVRDHIINDNGIGDMAWMARRGIVAVAGYPLIVSDRIVGVCACFAKRPFTETAQTALSWLTTSIAVSIDRLMIDDALTHTRDQNARLKSDLHRKHQELEEFTYIVSHDLQTPLRHLTCFSSMLCRDLGDDLTEQAAKDLAFISGAAEHMHTLIRDLLLLSRTGRAIMQMEDVPLDTCVDQAQGMLSHTLAIPLTSLRRDALPTIYGDRILLAQVYRHLIENALKFNGNVDPCIHLTAEPGNGHWILGVADNGVGIEPEHREQIFLPFKRLPHPNACAGTGIGLSICRKIIDRHGGRIWIESATDRGTWVKFTLHDAAWDQDHLS